MLYRKYINNHEIKDQKLLKIESIQKNTIEMFISVEDPGFYNHHGIQIRAIASAFRLNRKLGYNKWGGSTITQQLARSLILWPGKNYLRKYLEILSALTMEIVLNKTRILELYVNYIEFGTGIFGLGLASDYHFNTPFEKLEINEIAEIIAILPSPLKHTPGDFYTNDHLKRRYLYLMNRFSRENSK